MASLVNATIGSIANSSISDAYAEAYAESESNFYLGTEENDIEYKTRFQIGGQLFDEYLEELFGV